MSDVAKALVLQGPFSEALSGEFRSAFDKDDTRTHTLGVLAAATLLKGAHFAKRKGHGEIATIKSSYAPSWGGEVTAHLVTSPAQQNEHTNAHVLRRMSLTRVGAVGLIIEDMSFTTGRSGLVVYRGSGSAGPVFDVPMQPGPELVAARDYIAQTAELLCSVDPTQPPKLY